MARGTGSISKLKTTEEEEKELKGTTEAEANSKGDIENSKSISRQITKVMNNKKLIEEAEIAEYRRQMNFPAEVTRTVNNNSGGGTDSNSASMNKGSSYNRNSKRGTRLVRTR